MTGMILAGIAGVLIGAFLAWLILYSIPEPEHIRKYMSRVVNLEQLEEHEKLVRLRMIRNKIKTTRLDSGPNARVMRMRLRPKPKKP